MPCDSQVGPDVYRHTVLTLALGIGACTAIFSLIDAVMLKSLPVTDPSQLYQIGIGKSCCLTNGFEGDWGSTRQALQASGGCGEA